MINHKTLFGALLTALLLLGCAVFAPEPTATPVPTSTPEPTATATVTPTVTPSSTATTTATASPTATDMPEPTATATITPTPIPTSQAAEDFGFSEFALIEPGAYSFWYPDSFDFDQDGSNARLSLGAFSLLFSGFFESGETNTDAFVLEAADIVADVIEVDLVIGKPYEVTVDGIVGSAVDYEGEQNGTALAGTIVGVLAPQDLLFVVAARDHTATMEDWIAGGQVVQFGIIDTVELLTVEDSSAAGECLIADDLTYGLTEDNPVEVGGGAFGGPARARAFLDNLLGPGGETIEYSRTGSISTDETIVDTYELTFAGGDPLVIYVDQYNWSPPLAPTGLTCDGPFPLAEPES